MFAHVKMDFKETQRENIFYSRWLIMNKIYTLIIDGRSCSNIAIQRMVKKIQLTTIPLRNTYKLQWLSEKDETDMNQQVLLSFSNRKFYDKVSCEVVSMEISHLLLGRP